ncbi:stage V sporulation protein AE [Caldalkalibacillus salinus]|uniref:stage V sporulation protein AE n=1 Tax=Caldalkalibacillus salinus TaxID=2803787 RepID=UPI0019241754|nr:stage V sporulation protein AE [Caldalkalibacillus salinus]
MSEQKRKVVLITDGDEVASKTVQRVAEEVGGRCISRSSGNPTPLSGEGIVEQIKKAAYDPVLVMFDDCGNGGYGQGESALRYVATHPEIEVLGAVAVASNTKSVSGAHIDLSVDAHGEIIQHAVNKDGDVEHAKESIVYGDTVDVLDELQIPLIVGVGDIGKMHGQDDVKDGAPVTRQAVEIILQRSGFLDEPIIERTDTSETKKK